MDDLELPMSYDLSVGYSIIHGSTAYWKFSSCGKTYGAVCCSQTSAQEAVDRALRNMADVYKTTKQLEEK